MMALSFCVVIYLIYLFVGKIEKMWMRVEDPQNKISTSEWDPWEAPIHTLKTLQEGLHASRPRGYQQQQKLARALRHAQHFVLAFQFKRVHRLS